VVSFTSTGNAGAGTDLGGAGETVADSWGGSIAAAIGGGVSAALTAGSISRATDTGVTWGVIDGLEALPSAAAPQADNKTMASAHGKLGHLAAPRLATHPIYGTVSHPLDSGNNFHTVPSRARMNISLYLAREVR
jgi:hypothetical protein